MIVGVINEIYRILKPGGILRISLPDYGSRILREVVMCNDKGEMLYDPNGGGDYNEGGVTGGGHIWFPTYEIVNSIMRDTKFDIIDFKCYWLNDRLVRKTIDPNYGYLNRITNEMSDEAISCMMVDLKKLS